MKKNFKIFLMIMTHKLSMTKAYCLLFYIFFLRLICFKTFKLLKPIDRCYQTFLTHKIQSYYYYLYYLYENKKRIMIKTLHVYVILSCMRGSESSFITNKIN